MAENICIMTQSFTTNFLQFLVIFFPQFPKQQQNSYKQISTHLAQAKVELKQTRSSIKFYKKNNFKVSNTKISKQKK